ncbi:MAG: glycosyltransferase [Planctomycetia bacterium]|nr:glycosyltransferase [Planctomycetia bacterium]
MSLHVCHLAKYYPPAAGGIETHVQSLARGQCELGLRVTVLVVNHRDADGNEIFDRPWTATPAIEDEDRGVLVLRAPRTCAISKWDFSPKLSRRIRQLQSGQNRVDLLHLHTPNATMTLALWAAGLKVPLVITHHSDVIKQRFLAKGLALFERRLLGKAAKILTDSPPYAAGSAQLQPFLDKVEPLPLGIDPDPFLSPSEDACKFRDELRRRYPGPLWLSVGRLVYYKGLATAISALTEMRGTLLIIGEGPLRQELQSHATKMGLADRVVWLGKSTADELVGAYQAATALLFPSNARSEGFGLVQVEAMASGCPVINTAIPNSGVAWVSPHDETGLTIAMNSPAELAQAANRLERNSDLRNRLSRAGVDRARSLFHYRTMARKSLDLYRKVMDRPSSVRSAESSTDSSTSHDSSSLLNS